MFHGIFGCRYDLSGYPTIIVDFDDRYYVVINSNADPSLAPKDKASVTILTGANYYNFPERGTKDYLERRENLQKY